LIFKELYKCIDSEIGKILFNSRLAIKILEFDRILNIKADIITHFHLNSPDNSWKTANVQLLLYNAHKVYPTRVRSEASSLTELSKQANYYRRTSKEILKINFESTAMRDRSLRHRK